MPALPLDTTANHVRYLILAIQAEGERRLNEALRGRGLDLTATQSEVLEILAECGPLSQGELGERLVCTKGNISRLIDRMAAKEMLRREPDPADRRRVRIARTDHGRELTDAAFEVVAELLAAIRGLYTERELAELASLLGRLSSAFGMPVDERFSAFGPGGAA
ncbi:MAG: MarR family transcriptional regulator [Deinococcales bacterium]